MEEDIKILEESLKTKLFFYEKYYKALENLLTRYKQLEEENNKFNRLSIYDVESKYLEGKRDSDNYWKSKVKEKIEELNKLIIETQKELGSASKEFTIYVYQENILKELLGEE